MEEGVKQIGDGQLAILREMVRDHMRREGAQRSFSMGARMLLGMILELEERRGATQKAA